jgi:hypothetical protein
VDKKKFRRNTQKDELLSFCESFAGFQRKSVKKKEKIIEELKLEIVDTILVESVETGTESVLKEDIVLKRNAFGFYIKRKLILSSKHNLYTVKDKKS